MGNTTGQTPSQIISELIQKGHEFSFPQIMRLARNILGAGGTNELPEVKWEERVRVRPELSLGFPAADVSRVEQNAEDLVVIATFLGLYGSASPLPSHYNEDLMEEASADSSVSRDFLDILHRRLYQLFFQIWSKYRLFYRIAEEKNPLDQDRLFSLIGLSEKELRDNLQLDAHSLLRYSGLFMQIRSAEGMETLLRDAMAMRCIQVEQCLLRKVPIPKDQQMRMGLSGMRLGVDTVMGSEMQDRMGKFRINIGPLKNKEFDSFMPGTPQHNKLLSLIRLYILDPFDFDLKVVLAAGEVRPITLGGSYPAKLGWNTWCFSGYTLGEVNSIFPIDHNRIQLPITAADEICHRQETAEPPTLIDHYKNELAILRDFTTDYVSAHPDMAPMVSGHMADPGVERLLEATAFLNAHLQMKISDDIPEVVHELTEVLHPWNLKPVPATTIIAFTPKPELKQPLLIKAGAEVASVPVQGTQCRFKTCFDITVYPLTLLEASYSQPSGLAPSIKLQCELNGIGLSGWKTDSLRLFLGDDYPAACDLYLLLMCYLKRIIITSLDNGAAIEIAANCLKPAGFGESETMLAKQKSFMPGHLILQEYFLFQDKFLFIDLFGLEKCKTLGSGTQFEIRFELAANLPLMPQVTENSFVLSAVPVINLFEHKALPIFVDGELHGQAIHPLGKNSDQYHLYSVNSVEGLAKNRAAKIVYDLQNPLQRKSNKYSCQITHIKSALKDGFDAFISIPKQTDESQSPRIKLDIGLTCTNGALPDQLGLGEVCYSIRPTPEFVEPRNIKMLTPAVFQDIHPNRQWRLLSGFSLNSVSLEKVDNFRAILRLFVNANSRYQVAVMANNRRLDGIVSIEAKQTDRLLGRSMYRGYEISLKLRGDYFTGPGDLHMFCSVLERFLGGYVTQNCFIRFDVEEVGKGYRFEWPTRMGDRCVL